MEYRQRSFPEFSVCGLNCGLCPRYHTVGCSRCPGCAGAGFSDVHPPCGVLSCAQRRDIEHCFECLDFPCSKYDKADARDSFITHRNQIRDLERARQIGIEVYRAEQTEKMGILNALLAHLNAGRSKGFSCQAVNLIDLADLRTVMKQLEEQTPSASSQKEKAQYATDALNKMAADCGIDLKLRR